MRLLGPATLKSAVLTVRDGVADVVVDLTELVGLVGRAGDLMTRVEGLVTDAEAALSRSGALMEAAQGTLAEASKVLHRATGVLAEADGLVHRSAIVLDEAEAATQEASATLDAAKAASADAVPLIDRAGTLLARGDGLLSPLEALGGRALPLAEQVVNGVERGEVAALSTVVDRLPLLVQHLDEDVLPLMTWLDRVGPDVHAILEALEEISRLLAGRPGLSLFRKRGDRKEDEDALAVEGQAAGG